MELTKANMADKDAADRAFLAEIRQHTVNELKGLASPEVKAALRSHKYFNAWKIQISNIIQNGGDLARLAQNRTGEMAILKKRYANIEITNFALGDMVRETFGLEPPAGLNLDGLTLWSICQSHKILKQRISNSPREGEL